MYALDKKVHVDVHFQIHKDRFVAEHTIRTFTEAEALQRFYDPEKFYLDRLWGAVVLDEEGWVPFWWQWISDEKRSLSELWFFVRV